MAELTIEQARAVARARARSRLAAAAGGGRRPVRGGSRLGRPTPIPPQQEPQRPPTAADEALGLTSSFTQGVPFYEEALSGPLRGVTEAVQAPFRGEDVGEAYQRGWRAQVDAERGALGRARQERPIASNLLTGTAGALPVLASGGAALAPQVGQRGAALLLNQTARGATTGAATGYAYGAGAADGEDLSGRLEGGNRGAAVGAAIGGAAPTVINAIRGVAAPVIRALTPRRAAAPPARPAPPAAPPAAAAPSAPARAPAQVTSDMGAADVPRRPGMSGGEGALGRGPREDRYLFGRPNVAGADAGGTGGGSMSIPPTPTPPAAPPPQVPQPGRVARLADRARMGSEDVEGALQRARAQPQGQVLADIFDDAGVRQLRPIVQAPGRTGQLAAETAEGRFNEAPSIIRTAFNRRMGVGQTPEEALAALERDYRQTGTAYNRLWAQPVQEHQRQLFAQRIAPLLDPNNPNAAEREIMQWAVREARQQFELDLAEGIVRGNFDENLARNLHYIKMQLGRRADFEQETLTGPGGQRLGSIRRMYRRFADALDPGDAPNAIIPGYRELSRQAGDFFTARRAIQEGRAWIRENAETVLRRRQEMGPFELEHARIGLAEEVRHASRGQVVGNRNAANGMLNDPDVQLALTAAFDTPEQAAEFITLVNTQNKLMRNAGQWGTGSQTQGNQAYEAEGVVAAVAEMGGDLLGGRWGQAVNRAGRQIGNAVTGGMVERSNNQFGETLLRRIDSEESRAFADEVVRIIRDREGARTATARGAQSVGAYAGTQQRGDEQRQ